MSHKNNKKSSHEDVMVFGYQLLDYEVSDAELRKIKGFDHAKGKVDIKIDSSDDVTVVPHVKLDGVAYQKNYLITLIDKYQGTRIVFKTEYFDKDNYKMMTTYETKKF